MESKVNEELEINQIPYLYDQSGRVWMKENKVYRIIEDEIHICNYRELLNSDSIEELFAIGLVRTKILDESSSQTVLILEHEKIPFILHPCEYSNQMFWQAACMFIKLNIQLCKMGFLTQDSHPWNISYKGTVPIFYDFGSIIKANSVTENWFHEFFKGFIVSIWLASFSNKTYHYAKEYRREHSQGFGMKLFDSKKVKKIIFHKFQSFIKYKSNPEKLFNKILEWLYDHQPLPIYQEYWSDYYKFHSKDYRIPESIKQNFVYKILSDKKPEKVIDLASNKGYYSLMAAHLGASVIAIDYEEEVVNHLNSLIELKNITPAHIDFSKPTAALGVGLFWEDSFFRFKSDIVLALGLIHHLCISQNVPVYLFCETCMKYSKEGIVLEFVDPTDKHIALWQKKIPKDYSIEKVKFFMKRKFSNCDLSSIENSEGLNRTFMYFYN